MKWNIFLSIIILSVLFYSGLTFPPKLIKEKIIIIRRDTIWQRTHSTDSLFIYKNIYDLQPNKTYRYNDIAVFGAMQLLVDSIYIPLCNYASRKTGRKIEISVKSFYRTWYKKSQHRKGEAIDISVDSVYTDFGNYDLFLFVRDSLDFDQLIIYRNLRNPSHIHVSYVQGRNRKEVLFARKKGGGWQYKKL